MSRVSLSSIAWDVPESVYRQDPAYSYSTLAKFQREGFNNLSSLFDRVDSPSLTYGSLVDCLITGSKDEFNERFLVADFPELADSRIKVIKSVYLRTMGNTPWEQIPDDVFNSAIEENQFQMNWKAETRIKVIRECGKEYYDLLTVSDSKTLISNEVYNDALKAVDALKTSSATQTYFADDNPFNDGIERCYQLKFKGTFEGYDVRCMSDLLYCDHINKFVCPIDLKTSSHKEWDFYKSFIDWRYFIQAQLYWYIIRQNMNKSDVFKNYKLLDYRFVVVNNQIGQPKIPLAWVFTETQSELPFTYGRNEIPNWRDLVRTLDSYLKQTPEVPEGISQVLPNNLRSWIDSYYK